MRSVAETMTNTLDALGVPGPRREAFLDALRSGAWTNAPAELPVEVGSCLGDAQQSDRYEILAMLGHGASGAVYSARDTRTGEHVAIKLLRSATEREIERLRRETALLRMVRLPGVVGFLDEGTWDGQPFVVMERVEGEPFPGTRSRDWDVLAPVVVGLVETLARLHLQGIIHRDLKPANVLVVNGRPMVLDFGLARDERSGPDAIDTQLAGTPAYLAPEQFFGAPPGTRTDLYALGVMIYEAITGVRPFGAESVEELVQQVLLHTPPSLEDTAPELPGVVARVVMRMLSRDPLHRPRSAVEVLRVLQEAGELPRPRSTRLGSTAPLTRLESALRERRPIDVGGPRGSGRTRLLEDAAAALAGEGVPVAWTRSAVGPFESLVTVIGSLGDEPADLSAATGLAERRLCARLDAGIVLLVDDASALDPWSAALLQRVRGRGGVARVVDGPADLELAALAVDELIPLFKGHRRLFHIPDDAAALVHARVGGLPGRVLDRVAAWVRAGLGEWVSDRVAIERVALDRLATGLEVDPLAAAGEELPIERAAARGIALDDELAAAWQAVSLLGPHATLDRIAAMTGASRWSTEGRLAALDQIGALHEEADRWALSAYPPRDRWTVEGWVTANRAAAGVLPSTSVERLRCLLGAGELARIPAASLEIGLSEARARREGLAWVVLVEGLAVARRVGLRDAIPELLLQAVYVAVRIGTPRSLQLARAEVSRCDPTDDHHLGALSDLALKVLLGGSPGVVGELEALPLSPSLAFETTRNLLASFAAGMGPLDEHESWLRSVEDRYGGSAEAEDHLAGWRSRLLSRQSRFAEAAAQEEAVCRRRGWRALPSGTQAALYWIEAGDLDRAEQVLALVADDIQRLRFSALEGLAEALRRSLCYRRGELPEADPALQEAIVALATPALTAQMFLIEAAIAWRRGALGEALRCASISAEVMAQNRRPDGEALARALAVRCGQADVDPTSLLTEAARTPYPGIRAQIQALLGHPIAKEDLSALAVSYPPEARREVLSARELEAAAAAVVHRGGG